MKKFVEDYSVNFPTKAAVAAEGSR